MTPLPAQSLPLATTSPFTPRGRAGSADSPAWSRAWTHAAQMQQAASEHVEDAMDASRASWRTVSLATPGAKLGIASFAAASASTPNPALAAVASTSALATPSAATPIAFARSEFAPIVATPSPPPVGAPQDVRAAPGTAVAPAGRSMPCDPSLSTGELADAPPVRGAAQRMEQPAGTPRAPVRVHVDRQEDGCVVWLGVDAGAERLARQIVSQLAPSRAGALPVLAVVCNGVPVYTRPRVPKENP